MWVSVTQAEQGQDAIEAAGVWSGAADELDYRIMRANEDGDSQVWIGEPGSGVRRAWDAVMGA